MATLLTDTTVLSTSHGEFSHNCAGSVKPNPLPHHSQPLKQAPKSILKRRNGDHDHDCQVEHTSDPLQSDSYFLRPLRTLVASLDTTNDGCITAHDITESYSVLCSRIEAQADRLLIESQPGTYAAVDVIRTLPLNALCTVLRRDMALAFTAPHVSESSPSVSEPTSISDEEKTAIRDQSSLCHASLRLLACFSRLPALQSVFKLHELALLFKELTDIGLCQDLPSLSARKTYSHVLVLMNSQRLPVRAFRMFVPKVATVLERAALGSMGGNFQNGPHIEGLKTTRSLLLQHGDVFFPYFQRVFTRTLQNLVCVVPVYRELAAQTLAAFAHASLHHDIPIDIRLKYSSKISAFIDQETQRTKQRTPDTFVFRDFMQLSDSDPAIEQKTALLLNITASLFVLSGPRIFTRPRTLRLLVKAVEKTQRLRTRAINVLRAATWKCLVWAHAQIDSWGVPGSDSDGEIAHSAFCVVRQEYREDIGVALTACLLSPRAIGELSVNSVKEAVDLVFYLAGKREVRAVAATLLRRLLAGVLNDEGSNAYTWTDACVIPDWLSNGSTLQMSPKKLKKFLVGASSLDIHTVRILEEDELKATWEALLEAFTAIAVGQLLDTPAKKALEEDTIALWQALLRVQVLLTDNFDNPATAKHIISHLSAALVAIITAPHGSHPISASPALRTARQLWTIACSELGKQWHSSLAAPVFRRLAELHHHELMHGAMTDAWVQLSRALVLAQPQGALEALEDVLSVRAQREIWIDLVRYAVNCRDTITSSDSLASILLFPLSAKMPVLNESDDYDLWQSLFNIILFRTSDPGPVFASVSERLLRSSSSYPTTSLRRFFSFSLSRVCQHDRRSPDLTLLSAMSCFLRRSYPPQDLDDNEFMDVVPSLRLIMQAKPSMDVIMALEEGLVPWFEDKRCNIKDVYYNDDVLPLYCDIVRAMRDLPSAEDVILTLSGLLVAPFAREHIPEPAKGPLAFKAYWDGVAPDLDFGTRECPLQIVDCVVALSNAYGGEVPEWMHSQVQSQSQGRGDLIIPHSDEVVPPSVADLESSDPSFDLENADDFPEDVLETPKARPRNMGRTDDLDIPALSPSLGEPSEQFVRYRLSKDAEGSTVGDMRAISPSLGEPSGQIAHYLSSAGSKELVLSLDLDRARKRRRVYNSTPPGGENLELDSQSPVRESTSRSATPCARNRNAFDGVLLTPLEVEEKRKYTRFVSPEIDSRSSASSDDYESWEVNVSSQDVRDMRSSPVSRNDTSNQAQREPAVHVRGRGRPQGLSSAQATRSQTSSAVITHSGQKPAGLRDLRRALTTSSVPLDTLEQLRAAVSSDTRFLQTQDLAQAAQMIHEIAGIVNVKITEKLGEKRN
ncbi:hypothetical protein M0805_009722 [Coniferiporia weirii]|nr:hypothetical protein M0805_009722 [Coniferiporia weirii]